jgi:hypothetical protein
MGRSGSIFRAGVCSSSPANRPSRQNLAIDKELATVRKEAVEKLGITIDLEIGHAADGRGAIAAGD